MDRRYEAQQILIVGEDHPQRTPLSRRQACALASDCRSALAEAEVEYEDKTSTAIDVAFRAPDRDDFAHRTGIAVRPTHPVSVVIWTTTPWTLPANGAVTLSPILQRARVARPGDQPEQFWRAADLLRLCCSVTD